MIRINLLPSEIYVAEVRKQLKTGAFTFVGLVILCLLAFWATRLTKAEKLESELNQANGELKKYQAIVDKVNELEQTRNQLRARRDVIQQLLVGRLIYPKFFEDFMAMLPPEIWVTNMNTTLDPTGIVSVTISAQSLSNFAIADWLTSLQGSPLCSDVKLGTINATEQTDDTRPAILSFSINFKYLRKDA